MSNYNAENGIDVLFDIFKQENNHDTMVHVCRLLMTLCRFDDVCTPTNANTSCDNIPTSVGAPSRSHSNNDICQVLLDAVRKPSWVDEASICSLASFGLHCQAHETR